MPRRFLSISILALAACSQRAPFRVVSGADGLAAPVAAPATGSRAEAASTTTTPPLATVAPATSAVSDAAAAAHVGSLYFPVSPMDSLRLDDSFDAPRDGGARVHNAIDIMAPRGSAVLAVQDGQILRLSKSAKGGTTIYAADIDQNFVYYYAHLDRYHANVYQGKPLMRGDTLGYVGTTGNSPKDLPHLHFQVMRMPADKRFWAGEPINPYPLLKAKPAHPAP
jgi:murein DD-endopeptidase MepM/ murein hydrolase activator NlpD